MIDYTHSACKFAGINLLIYQSVRSVVEAAGRDLYRAAAVVVKDRGIHQDDVWQTYRHGVYFYASPTCRGLSAMHHNLFRSRRRSPNIREQAITAVPVPGCFTPTEEGLPGNHP
ncbi:hypothetical protein Bbelb_223960 [Branchiostoma belcheri]|nr:hypothetical protein Bbelb_223960 [Branchiostoma belcheri]